MLAQEVCPETAAYLAWRRQMDFEAKRVHSGPHPDGEETNNISRLRRTGLLVGCMAIMNARLKYSRALKTTLHHRFLSLPA